MKCLNVIVYYNNPNEVKEYIENCYDCGKDKVDIFVVINEDINNEAKGLLTNLQKKYKTLKFVDYKENVGYLNSLLNVIKSINLDEYKYFILSNTDITYNNENFFEYLLNYNYQSNIGCIAPSVYSTNTKSYSNPHYMKRIPKAKLILLSSIYKFASVGKLYIKLGEIKNKKNVKEKNSCFVYSPHGCYMIFSNSFIKKIRDFKYGVKLYSEESCVGELLLREKMKCFFDNKLKVKHNESTVTGKIDYRLRFKYWKESIDYILKEFY